MAIIFRKKLPNVINKQNKDRAEFIDMQYELGSDVVNWLRDRDEDDFNVRQLAFFDYDLESFDLMNELSEDIVEKFDFLLFESIATDILKDPCVSEFTPVLAPDKSYKVDFFDDDFDYVDTTKSLTRSLLEDMHLKHRLNMTTKKFDYFYSLKDSTIGLYYVVHKDEASLVIRDIIDVSRPVRAVKGGGALNVCFPGDIIGLRLVTIAGKEHATNGVCNFSLSDVIHVVGGLTYDLIVSKAPNLSSQEAKLLADKRIRYFFRNNTFNYSKDTVEEDGFTRMFSFVKGTPETLKQCPITIDSYHVKYKRILKEDFLRIDGMRPFTKSSWFFQGMIENENVLAHLELRPNNELHVVTSSEGKSEKLKPLLLEKSDLLTWQYRKKDTLFSVCPHEKSKSSLTFSEAVPFLYLAMIITKLREEMYAKKWIRQFQEDFDETPRAAMQDNEQAVNDFLSYLKDRETRRAEYLGIEPLSIEPVVAALKGKKYRADRGGA